jgi:hypothetical protein
MLTSNIYCSKNNSLSAVGVDRPEFTPLERDKSLDEGGSLQVGGGHASMVREAHGWEKVKKRHLGVQNKKTRKPK